METIANIEDGVRQHGAIRAVRGWVREGADCRYLAVQRQQRVYLFKIVYTFPRNSDADRDSHLMGFLAEIVYGSAAFKGTVLAASPDRGRWVVADDDGAVLGMAGCAPKGEAALDPAPVAA